jgi:hypothetical protein
VADTELGDQVVQLGETASGKKCASAETRTGDGQASCKNCTSLAAELEQAREVARSVEFTRAVIVSIVTLQLPLPLHAFRAA